MNFCISEASFFALEKHKCELWQQNYFCVQTVQNFHRPAWSHILTHRYLKKQHINENTVRTVV